MQDDFKSKAFPEIEVLDLFLTAGRISAILGSISDYLSARYGTAAWDLPYYPLLAGE